MCTPQYDLDSIVEECQTIFETLPMHIETLCDNFTSSMTTLHDILLIKAHMVNLSERIVKMRHPVEEEVDPRLAVIFNNNMARMARRLSTEKNSNMKKLRVLPMIKGHVISTGSTVILSRLSQGKYCRNTVSEPPTLSPIIENSPARTPSRSECVRELRIPLLRLDMNLVNKSTSPGTHSSKKRYQRPCRKTRARALPTQEHQQVAITENTVRTAVTATRRDNSEVAAAAATDDMRRRLEDLEERERDNHAEDTGDLAVELRTNMAEGEEGEVDDAKNKSDSTVLKTGLSSTCSPEPEMRAEDPLEGPSWLLDRSQSPTKILSSPKSLSSAKSQSPTKSRSSTKSQSPPSSLSPTKNKAFDRSPSMRFINFRRPRMKFVHSLLVDDNQQGDDVTDDNQQSDDASDDNQQSVDVLDDKEQYRDVKIDDVTEGGSADGILCKSRMKDAQPLGHDMNDSLVSTAVTCGTRVSSDDDESDDDDGDVSHISESSAGGGTVAASTDASSSGTPAPAAGNTSVDPVQQPSVPTPHLNNTRRGLSTVSRLTNDHDTTEPAGEGLKRCRRKAAPLSLKEVPINTKLRRT